MNWILDFQKQPNEDLSMYALAPMFKNKIKVHTFFYIFLYISFYSLETLAWARETN